MKNVDLTKLSIAVSSVITILQTGKQVIDLSKVIATNVVNYYTAFIDNKTDGLTKKQIVLDLIRDTWDQIIAGNLDYKFQEWVILITNFIDALHSAYTALMNDTFDLKNQLFGIADN